MSHIKWIGIINSEIADYQKGNLDCRAKKMVLPATMKEMMIKALPFAVVPFTVIFYPFFLKLFLLEKGLYPLYFLLLDLLLVLLD